GERRRLRCRRQAVPAWPARPSAPPARSAGIGGGRVRLEVRDLRVAFGDRVVAHVPELAIESGESVGIAGESGSGKSMTAMAILGLTEKLGASVAGSVRLDGRELVGAPESELRAIRGRRI